VPDHVEVRFDRVLYSNGGELDEAAVDARITEADIDRRPGNDAGVVIPDLLAVSLERSFVPG
jgi:hypothetical protein